MKNIKQISGIPHKATCFWAEAVAVSCDKAAERTK
jgi:hypothetical protein